MQLFFSSRLTFELLPGFWYLSDRFLEFGLKMDKNEENTKKLVLKNTKKKKFWKFGGEKWWSLDPKLNMRKKYLFETNWLNVKRKSWSLQKWSQVLPKSDFSSNYFQNKKLKNSRDFYYHRTLNGAWNWVFTHLTQK